MKHLLVLAMLATLVRLADAQVPFHRRPSQVRAISQPDQTQGNTKSHPSVARVIVTERDGTSFGSGTLVDVRGTHGLVITNWHVVRDAAGPIKVVFPNGFESPARVHKVDKDWDLAALDIWSPSLTPVSLSTVPPRPGDMLTIAGYGSGDYRSVSGRCTQYLAPDDDMPFEIVELSASARQGDSGGPIFNQSGELAGVLFGEGGGATCGSYCGRVSQFLANVVPISHPALKEDQLANIDPKGGDSSSRQPYGQPLSSAANPWTSYEIANDQGGNVPTDNVPEAIAWNDWESAAPAHSSPKDPNSLWQTGKPREGKAQVPAAESPNPLGRATANPRELANNNYSGNKFAQSDLSGLNPGTSDQYGSSTNLPASEGFAGSPLPLNGANLETAGPGLETRSRFSGLEPGEVAPKSPPPPQWTAARQWALGKNMLAAVGAIWLVSLLHRLYQRTTI